MRESATQAHPPHQEEWAPEPLPSPLPHLSPGTCQMRWGARTRRGTTSTLKGGACQEQRGPGAPRSGSRPCQVGRPLPWCLKEGVALSLPSGGSRCGSSRTSGDFLGPGHEPNWRGTCWLLSFPCSHLPVPLPVLTTGWGLGERAAINATVYPWYEVRLGSPGYPASPPLLTYQGWPQPSLRSQKRTLTLCLLVSLCLTRPDGSSSKMINRFHLICQLLLIDSGCVGKNCETLSRHTRGKLAVID